MTVSNGLSRAERGHVIIAHVTGMIGLDGEPRASVRTLRRKWPPCSPPAADPAVYAPQVVTALHEVQRSVVDDGIVACLPTLRAVQGRFARHLAGLIEDEIVPGGWCRSGGGRRPGRS